MEGVKIGLLIGIFVSSVTGYGVNDFQWYAGVLAVGIVLELMKYLEKKIEQKANKAL